jgi:tRNA threonylcarbamoyl adenosine modification protein YeaZ
MKILAIEFSSSRRSVAVLSLAASGRLVAAGEAIESGGRTTRAIGMIEAALDQAQIEREQIDRLAIGLGPGSYHGIRTAIALAQGWQLARKVEAVGVGSAEVLAEQARIDGLRGTIDVVIDAQRNEFYVGRYSLDQEHFTEIEPLRLATQQAIESRLSQGAVAVGPDLTRTFAKTQAMSPTAAALARLAVTRVPISGAEKLEPIYLRETSFVKATHLRGPSTI